LPDEIRSLLDRAVAQSGKSLSQEIQQRLVWTFEQELLDKPTRDLLVAVISLAALIRTQLGQAWYEQAGANEVFSAAIGSQVLRQRPPGEIVLPPAEERLIATDDPVALGVAIEALFYQVATIGTETMREQIEKEVKKAKGGKS
jgi:hypothetical protein